MYGPSGGPGVGVCACVCGCRPEEGVDSESHTTPLPSMCAGMVSPLTDEDPQNPSSQVVLTTSHLVRPPEALSFPLQKSYGMPQGPSPNT